jgi:cobalt-zinc-cadmium efflux system outer membrane protein
MPHVSPLGAAALGLFAAGCGAVDPAPEWGAWRSAVAERTASPASEACAEPWSPPTAGLTEADAVRTALERHPAIRAELARIGIAKADLEQAGLLPNPTASGNVLFGSGVPTLFNFDVVTELSALANRPLRVEAAGAGVARSVHEAVETTMGELAEVRRTWRELVFAEAAVALLTEAEELAGRSREATEALRQGGSATQLDANLAESQHRQAAAERISAEGRAARLRAELAHRMAVPGLAVGPLPPLSGELSAFVPPEPAEALQAALAGRAALLAADARVREAEVRLRLARREVVPFPQVGVAGQDNPPSSFGPQFGVEIPIFDQGLPRIARAEFALDEARRLREAAELAVRRELAAVLAELAALQRQEEEIRTRLLPLAERSLTLAREAQAAGGASILTVLTAQQAYLDARRRLLAVRRDLAVQAVELERVVGRWSHPADPPGKEPMP